MAIWSPETKELEKLYESLKGQFPELEKELGQLIKSEDANVILLYSRRCLEVIITDLCECVLTPQIVGHNLKNKLGLIKFGNYDNTSTKIYI
jgi:hypothetical protein